MSDSFDAPGGLNKTNLIADTEKTLGDLLDLAEKALTPDSQLPDSMEIVDEDNKTITLSELKNAADNAVAKNGGDATNTKVTGKSVRNLGDKLTDNLNITDYGADGTVTNDTTAIINANNDLAKNTFNASLDVKPNLNLVGDDSNNLRSANKLILLGDGTSKLTGKNRTQIHDRTLPTPFMFKPNISRHQLKNSIIAAIVRGVLRVAVMGDSIPSIGDNLISIADHPFYSLIDEIQKQNPKLKIIYQNFAIGGKTWGDMWSDSSQPPAWLNNSDGANWAAGTKLNWKQTVCAFNPDLLWLYSGGNDGYGFDAVAFQNLIQYFQTPSNFSTGNIPDLIFGCTYQPSLGSTTNNYIDVVTQNGIDFCSTYIRNFALTNDYGFLDFARWHAMCRDGIDIRELMMERVQPDSNTVFTAYETKIPVNGSWDFPNAKTGNDVSAASCTSFLFDFSIDFVPSAFEIQLSRASANSLTPTRNPCFIIPDNGKIKVTYCDGVTRDVKAITSDIDWPTGESAWSITVKDSRLKIDVQQPLNNGWDINNQGAHQMGMGYVNVFDENVARFGAPYTPNINFGGSGNITIHNFTVADNTNIQDSGHRSSCQRFRPIISDSEIYVESDNEYGGSGSYHMNGYGYRLIMTPVIRAVNWQLSNINYEKQLNVGNNIFINDFDPSKEGIYVDYQSAGFAQIMMNTKGKSLGWSWWFDSKNSDGTIIPIRKIAEISNDGAFTCMGNYYSYTGTITLNGSTHLTDGINNIYFNTPSFGEDGLYAFKRNDSDSAIMGINAGKDSTGTDRLGNYLFKFFNSDGSNYPIDYANAAFTGTAFRISPTYAYGVAGVGMWNTNPPTTKPSITLTSPTDNEKLLANLLISYGIADITFN